MLDTIDELAGIHFYNPQDAESIQTIKSEQLGTLFRELATRLDGIIGMVLL
jgi:siderophore synthetase component